MMKKKLTLSLLVFGSLSLNSYAQQVQTAGNVGISMGLMPLQVYNGLNTITGNVTQINLLTIRN